MSNYPTWSKILELWGLSWWRVRPLGTKQKKERRQGYLAFCFHIWGSGGRRFKSSHPDSEAKKRLGIQNVWF